MNTNTRRLARALGWFSIGLATAELAATSALGRFIGIHPDAKSRALMKGAGARELLAGAGLLSGRATRAWLWSRTLGDVMDLGLLGGALPPRRSDKRRIFGAAGAVLGALALDAYATWRASARQRSRVVAITVDRPLEEVSRLWHELVARGGVFFSLHDEPRLVRAPGGRGTEVQVSASGIVEATRARNDLRRFKQTVEVGEILHSDASRYERMHPARPGEEERGS